jgi:hypothetical protein
MICEGAMIEARPGEFGIHFDIEEFRNLSYILVERVSSAHGLSPLITSSF